MYQPWKTITKRTKTDKNRKNKIPTPWPPTQTLRYLTTPQPSNPPITWNNNTMIMIFLAQMRQCSGCGSVRNNVTFNSHLGSDEDHWVRSSHWEVFCKKDVLFCQVFLFSPWDRGCLGIKKGIIDVIYYWKAYLLEIQEIHVNTHKSVKGMSYGSPL